MPTLFVFLIKVNVALLLFCAGYYIVLRHLTFYTLNRIYLVAAILFATVYPQINLFGFVQRHQQIAKPVRAVVINWQAPAEKFVGQLAPPSYWYWLEVVFWAGTVLLALRLLVQLFSLYKLYQASTAANIFGHDVRLVSGETGPFSFWKSIYVNPSNHEPSDLKAILLHEQVHVNEWHTLDILLAELSSIFYWFNPGIWLMKKAIRENIEFITDRKILKNGADSKQYQYSLVSVGLASSSNTIVNHFNLSTIKKRIIMMNAKRSSKFNITRYVFLVPAVVTLLLVFSISKAALVKKSSIAYKVPVVKINGNPILINKSMVTLVKEDSPIKAKVRTRKDTDTIKKGNFIISTTHHSDSLNYVINGLKATKAEFNSLDSSRIYSIEIMSAEQARKIYDQIDNNNDVLFLTTNNSEAGKKFKQKLDKLNGVDGVNTNIAAIANGRIIKGGTKNGVITNSVSSGDGTNAITTIVTSVGGYDVVGAQVTPKIYKLKRKHLVGGKYTVDTLTMISNDKPTVIENDLDSTKVYTLSMGKGVYTINQKYPGENHQPFR